MPNENAPNKDHWKELLVNLDLDVEFDDTPLEKGDEAEALQPSLDEKVQEEIPSAVAPIDESVPTSKVDPLFDLGWNTPEESKAGEVKEEAPELILSEEPVAEEPIIEKSTAPSKKPKQRPPKQQAEHRGFGFGLLPEEPEEEEFTEEKEEPKEEPVMTEENSKPIDDEQPKESLFSEPAKPKEEKPEAASDWMALAAQLGVPIRSESEAEASSEAATDEEEPVEEVSATTEDEEYDPLAAWGAPAAPSKPKAAKPSRHREDSPEVATKEQAESEEPIIIGKSKDDEESSQKERRRRGRRGRGRRRERDVEAEIVVEEEAVEVEVELFEDEKDDAEERPTKRRRRRSRRSRKPAAAVAEDIQEEDGIDSIDDIDIIDDVDIIDTDDFDDEEEDSTRKATSKTHRAIPSWEETIGIVVDKNLGKRSSRDESRSPRSRGGRGRSGRRGNRSKE